MMDLFLKFDINIFSTLMLLLILMIMGQRRDTLSYSSRLFKRLIFVNILMLNLEIVSWMFDLKAGTFNWYANYVSNMAFAWLGPLITCVWASYVDYRMFGSMERLKKKWYYVQPMILNTLLLIVNLFVPIVFSVSPENVYSREPFMWLIIVNNSLMLIYICYLAFKNRAVIQKKIIYMILLFVCLPAVTAGFQVLIYGVFIMWPMMAICLVVTYIYIETASTSFDYLTGLYSRLRLDEYIDYLIGTHQEFGVIMLDLNDFKKINDTYGHHKGDEALIAFSKSLSKVFVREKMVGRFAGDEFIVITSALSQEKRDVYIKELDQILTRLNQFEASPYKLEYSEGYCGSVEFNKVTYKDLVNTADERMYVQKSLKKNNKPSQLES